MYLEPEEIKELKLPSDYTDSQAADAALQWLHARFDNLRINRCSKDRECWITADVKKAWRNWDVDEALFGSVRTFDADHMQQLVLLAFQNARSWICKEAIKPCREPR